MKQSFLRPTGAILTVSLLALPLQALAEDTICGPYAAITAQVVSQYGMALSETRATGEKDRRREIWKKAETDQMLIMTVRDSGETCVEAIDPTLPPFELPE